MEGSDLYGFIPYSRNGGHTWQVTTIAGSVQMSGLVLENQRDGWVTDISSNYKKVEYKTTDGGIKWQRSGHRPKITVPSTVSGISASTRGTVPAGLTIKYAIRFPGGLTWAQATGPAVGPYYPTYLLRLTADGRAWTTVPGR